MQRTRTKTPPTILAELGLFEIFLLKIMYALGLEYRQESFHDTWYKKKASSDDLQEKKAITPPKGLKNFAPLKLSVFVTLKPTKLFSWNLVQGFISDDMQKKKNRYTTNIFATLCPFGISIYQELDILSDKGARRVFGSSYIFYI